MPQGGKNGGDPCRCILCITVPYSILQLTNNWNGDGAHHIEGLLTRTMNDGFHG